MIENDGGGDDVLDRERSGAAMYLVRAGRLLDPAAGVDRPQGLLIAGGRVERLCDIDAPLPSGAVEVDARHKLVVPGFIDIHVHFRDPGPGLDEDVASGARSAAAGGFTTACCMANTSPVNDSVEVLAPLVERIRAHACIEVLPIAAVTKGLAGRELTDFAALRRAGAIALSDDGRPIMEAAVMEAALRRARELGLVLIDHAENMDLTAGGVIHAGEVSRALGLPGINRASECEQVRQDARLAEKTGARLHVCHVSASTTFDVVRRFKAQGVPITAEVTPHHLTLTDAFVRAAAERGDAGAGDFKMNPPLRGEEDVAAAREAILDGTIDAIATDHAPHTAEAKSRGLLRAPFGVVGLETAFPVLYTELVLKDRLLTLPRLIHLLTAGPAGVLGLERGTLAPGRRADLVVLDLERTFRVEPAGFRSRSRNTPYAGWELTGTIDATWSAGRAVHSRKAS